MRRGFAILVFLCGCGDPVVLDAGTFDASADAAVDAGSPDAGDGCLSPTPAADLDAFEVELRRAICRYYACAGLSIDGTQYRSDADCARWAQLPYLFVDTYYADTLRDLRAGRVLLDREGASACVEGIASCDYLDAWHGEGYVRLAEAGPCDHVVRPRCPAGIACLPWGGGCGPDQGCQFLEGEAPCAVYGCRRLVDVGMPCTSSEECRPSTDEVPIACVHESGLSGPGTCRRVMRSSTPAMLGEPCGALEPTGEPVMVVGCGDGALCVFELDAAPTCHEPLYTMRGEGEACEPGRDLCEPGLFCDVVCRPIELVDPVAPGGPCAPDDLCDRQVGTACLDGICVEAGGAAGTACDVRGRESDVCTPPAFCDVDTGLCSSSPSFPLGDLCLVNEECESFCCDYERDMLDKICLPAERCDVDPMCR